MSLRPTFSTLTPRHPHSVRTVHQAWGSASANDNCMNSLNSQRAVVNHLQATEGAIGSLCTIMRDSLVTQMLGSMKQSCDGGSTTRTSRDPLRPHHMQQHEGVRLLGPAHRHQRAARRTHQRSIPLARQLGNLQSPRKTKHSKLHTHSLPQPPFERLIPIWIRIRVNLSCTVSSYLICPSQSLMQSAKLQIMIPLDPPPTPNGLGW